MGRPRLAVPNITLSVRISEPLAAELERFAVTQGCTRNRMAEEAILAQVQQWRLRPPHPMGGMVHRSEGEKS